MAAGSRDDNGSNSSLRQFNSCVGYKAKPPSVTKADNFFAVQVCKFGHKTAPLFTKLCPKAAVYATLADVFADNAQGAFFQTGDLGLGDAYKAGNLHLGFSAHKAQIENLLFPRA